MAEEIIGFPIHGYFEVVFVFVPGGGRLSILYFFRWRKFCSVLHENATLCVTERFGLQELTVPR